MNINLAINHGSKILSNKFMLNPKLDSELLMAKIINKDMSLNEQENSRTS